MSSYFCSMALSSEDQALIDFFSGRELPGGTQHVNEYSVFLDLAGAVNTHLRGLHSDVEASKKASVILLKEVQNWLNKV